MRVEDMVLLSIDDHTIEPPDMFDRYMPAKYKDDAPRLVKNAEGRDQWLFQGEAVGIAGLSAVASWPKEEWGFNPTDFSEMRPGCYDIDARIDDMNANGMLAGMNFPTFAGFAGTHLAKMPDQKLTGAAISAYNDWAIDELAGEHPGRFIPLAVLPILDIDRSVAEIRRVAAKGCVAVSLPETPYGIGLPSFASGHWDPVFAALLEAGMTPCMHIGGAFGLLKRPEEALQDDIIILAPQVMTVTTTDILLSGLLRRFPDLRSRFPKGGSDGFRSSSTASSAICPTSRGPTSTSCPRARRSTRCGVSTSSPASSRTRRRFGCAIGSGSRLSHGSATIRTPIRPGRCPRRHCTESSPTPAATTRRST